MFVELASETSMKKDFFIEEDFSGSYGDGYLGFRRLCAAVFGRAVADLFSGNSYEVSSAVQWFKRKPCKKEGDMVYFQDCLEMLSFTESRLKKLRVYIFNATGEKDAIPSDVLDNIEKFKKLGKTHPRPKQHRRRYTT